MYPLSVDAIQKNLHTHTIGQTIVYYNQIDSTNNELRKLVEDAPEGLLLITDHQTAGRGRFNRNWYAPPASSLLASLLFRPTFLPPQQIQQLTMLCSLAAVEAIARQINLSVGIKWPNDLVYREKKLAGILTEASFVSNTVEWVIVGLGLNVNVDFRARINEAEEDEFSLTETATSLQMIARRQIPRIPLLQSYLTEVEKRYDALKQGRSQHPDWAAHLTTLGAEITVTTPQNTFHGLAQSVDETGALVVVLPTGRVERVLAGDVSLRNVSPKDAL